MAITLNKIVNSPKEYTSLSDVRESILAAARAAKEAERRDSVVIELDAGAYNLTQPFVLSSTENPELSFVGAAEVVEKLVPPKKAALKELNMKALELGKTYKA